MECALPKEAKVEVEALAPILLGDVWMFHVDRASNVEGFGAGMALASPDDIITEKSLWFRFKTSNNEVEYEALLAGLILALRIWGAAYQGP